MRFTTCWKKQICVNIKINCPGEGRIGRMFKSDILNFTPFGEKVCLSSPTMHGDEMNYITEAFETNWVTTIGENINEIERIMAAANMPWRCPRAQRRCIWR